MLGVVKGCGNMPYVRSSTNHQSKLVIRNQGLTIYLPKNVDTKIQTVDPWEPGWNNNLLVNFKGDRTLGTFWA
jgi:hypothetical protein